MCYTEYQFIDNLDPTFLYTWQGTRTRDEINYHSHQHAELAFILSGSGKYRIDGRIYSVSEGDFIIINPGVKHQAILGNAATPTTEFFVGCQDFCFRGCAKNHLPLPDDSVIMHTTGELRQKLFKICTAMAAENSVYQQGKYFMLKSYLIQMMLLIIREQAAPVENVKGCSFESTNKKYIVDKMVSYFEDHYNEKISLDHIAENMYLSPFYISKIFKTETGDSPIHYLINIRLEKAKELLETGWDGNIQDVAAVVGYDDAYHFSKLFKKKYGISPKNVKNNDT